MRNPAVPGNDDDLIKAASIFIATDSPLGPAYLSYGHADTGDSSVYLFLGLPY
jgi:NTE family protein